MAGSAPEAMGGPYAHGTGTAYASLLGLPIEVLAANRDTLLRARNQTHQRNLSYAAFVEARFSLTL